MKIIEVDEELYQYIAAQTQSIGESASDILRRLLNLPTHAISSVDFFESLASAETPNLLPQWDATMSPPPNLLSVQTKQASAPSNISLSHLSLPLLYQNGCPIKS